MRAQSEYLNDRQAATQANTSRQRSQYPQAPPSASKRNPNKTQPTSKSKSSSRTLTKDDYSSSSESESDHKVGLKRSNSRYMFDTKYGRKKASTRVVDAKKPPSRTAIVYKSAATGAVPLSQSPFKTNTHTSLSVAPSSTSRSISSMPLSQTSSKSSMPLSRTSSKLGLKSQDGPKQVPSWDNVNPNLQRRMDKFEEAVDKSDEAKQKSVQRSSDYHSASPSTGAMRDMHNDEWERRVEAIMGIDNRISPVLKRTGSNRSLRSQLNQTNSRHVHQILPRQN